VKAPTLVLWGEDDSFLSKKFTEGLDQLIQAPFELKLVPQCGHWIQQEVPHLVNRELISFLRQSGINPEK
jgi:pimeloyl-ACP methyl ester carboxylesterase